MFFTIQILLANRFWSKTNDEENEISPEESVTNLLNDLGINNFQRQTIQTNLKHVKEPFIQEYINSTIGIGLSELFELKVDDVFEINRPDEAENFRRDLHNRRFLWHGTRKANIFSILRDGFDLKYAGEGMFDRGIYFADCCTKSLNYCDFLEPNAKENKYNYLFLCEVALGDMEEYEDAVYNAKQKLGKKHSVLGKGTWAPPFQIQNTDGISYSDEPLELTRLWAYLNYNEYIVYDTNQIRLRYLVKVSNVPLSCFQYFLHRLMPNFCGPNKNPPGIKGVCVFFINMAIFFGHPIMFYTIRRPCRRHFILLCFWHFYIVLSLFIMSPNFVQQISNKSIQGIGRVVIMVGYLIVKIKKNSKLSGKLDGNVKIFVGALGESFLLKMLC